MSAASESSATDEISTRVFADLTTVFNLLSEVELWPAIFRHVRSARVLRRAGPRRLITVRASWHGLPLRWTAVLTLDPTHGELTFRHLGALTKGTVVTWAVRHVASTGLGRSSVDVTVRQTLMVRLPLVGGLLAGRAVGGRVARELDQAMLDRVKEIAEGGSLAGRV